MVPRGGLEPPRREALTPEASVSTNSTTEASAVDAVHIMRRPAIRQPEIGKILQLFCSLANCSATTKPVSTSPFSINQFLLTAASSSHSS